MLLCSSNCSCFTTRTFVRWKLRRVFFFFHFLIFSQIRQQWVNVPVHTTLIWSSSWPIRTTLWVLLVMKGVFFFVRMLFVLFPTIVKATQQISRQPGFNSLPQALESLLSATYSTLIMNTKKENFYLPLVVGFCKVVTVVCVDLPEIRKITRFFFYSKLPHVLFVLVFYSGIKACFISLIEGLLFHKKRRRMFFLLWVITSDQKKKKYYVSATKTFWFK